MNVQNIIFVAVLCFNFGLLRAESYASEPYYPNANCPPADSTLLIPYPGSCSKYYRCWYGYAYAMICSDGLEWSTELRQCQPPNIAKCSQNGNDPTSTTTIPPPTTEEALPNSNCPPDDDGQTPTQLAYPGNCLKFYKCENGYAYPMDCPTGLEWSSRSHRCEWPDVAQCDPNQDDPTSTPSNPTTEQPALNSNCPLDDDGQTPTQFTYPGNCSKFYKCQNGYAFPMDCQTDLEWSVKSQRCEWPDVAQCDPNQDDPTSTPPIPTTEQPALNSNCPLDDDGQTPTQFAYPGNCSKFYKCQNGYAFPMDCQTDLEWSVKSQRCEWPDVAQCDPNQDDPTSTPPIPTTEQPALNSNCPLDDDGQTPTQLAYPGNCSKFYKCQNGYAFPMDCQTDLEWSVTSQRCEWPDVAQCDPNLDDPTSTPSNPTTEQPALNSNCPLDDDGQTPTQFAYPGNCSKFYKCQNGYAFPMDCQTDLEWSVKSQRCEWPDVAQCDPNQDDPTSSPPIPTTEKPALNSNCPLDDDGQTPTQFAYPGNCSKFYKCQNGYAFPMECQAGLEWSIRSERCEWPDIAQCDPNAGNLINPPNPPTGLSIPPYIVPDTDEPKNNSNCPHHEDVQAPTYLPYPGDCSKYYKCLDGLAYPQNCLSGLQWSIEFDRCRWPDIANCDPNGSAPEE